MVKIDECFLENKIMIGENKDDNDLIISQAKQSDIWFHLANLPSCHVIIENSKENPVTKEMIKYCCLLVKQNTKYKNIGKLRVQYCSIKQVKRTNEPGKVTLTGKISSIVV